MPKLNYYKLVEILQDFASAAYWHGEATGDYDMDSALDEEFFVEAIEDIYALCRKED